MTRRLIAPLLLLTCVCALGCSSGRYIYRDASNGIVAISSNSNRQQAEELMQKHFPEGYVIERENEVITGSHAHWSEEEDDGSGCVSTTAENATEYLIFYRSQSAPAIDEESIFRGKQQWERSYYSEIGQFQAALDELPD